jgi:hypothetical protein
MSTRSALAELRRKKRCIERAIRALEQLQRMEEEGEADTAGKPSSKISNVVELPRRLRRN